MTLAYVAYAAGDLQDIGVLAGGFWSWESSATTHTPD
jgi:hypothetical protein